MISLALESSISQVCLECVFFASGYLENGFLLLFAVFGLLEDHLAMLLLTLMTVEMHKMLYAI